MKGVGGTLTLVGAVAVGVSAFLAWTGDHPPRVLPMRGLVNGYGQDASANMASSLGLALLFVAFIMVAATVSGSRLLSLIGGLVGAGLIAVWAYRSRSADTVGTFVIHHTQYGLWLATFGVICSLLAAFVPREVKETV